MQPQQQTPILKDGVRTSEFWLTLITISLSTVLPFVTNDQIAQVIGILISVLATFGYTYSRTTVKAAALNNPSNRTINVVKQPTPPVTPPAASMDVVPPVASSNAAYVPAVQTASPSCQ